MFDHIDATGLDCSNSFILVLGGYPNTSEKLLHWKRPHPKEKHVQKRQKQYTPFCRTGDGGSREEEERLESQQRVVLSHGQSPPLIYPGVVTSPMLMAQIR